MPCQQYIADAKATFVSKVSEGISTLMKFGYSRERATTALLRELTRGETNNGRPTDEEIFDTMKRFNLGIDEATKAIMVSKAMRRAMLSSTGPAQAIEVLANKISMSNLLYESCEEEDDDSSTIRPELRVEPLVPTRRQVASMRRKRPIEEIAFSPDVEEQEPKKATRVRADSVAEELEQKIHAKKSTECSSGNDSSTSSNSASMRTPVVRGKRAKRVDDAENQAVHMRIRGSEGC